MKALKSLVVVALVVVAGITVGRGIEQAAIVGPTLRPNFTVTALPATKPSVDLCISNFTMRCDISGKACDKEADSEALNCIQLMSQVYGRPSGKNTNAYKQMGTCMVRRAGLLATCDRFEQKCDSSGGDSCKRGDLPPNEPNPATPTPQTPPSAAPSQPQAPAVDCMEQHKGNLDACSKKHLSGLQSCSGVFLSCVNARNPNRNCNAEDSQCYKDVATRNDTCFDNAQKSYNACVEQQKKADTPPPPTAAQNSCIQNNTNWRAEDKEAGTYQEPKNTTDCMNERGRDSDGCNEALQCLNAKCDKALASCNAEKKSGCYGTSAQCGRTAGELYKNCLAAADARQAECNKKVAPAQPPPKPTQPAQPAPANPAPTTCRGKAVEACRKSGETCNAAASQKHAACVATAKRNFSDSPWMQVQVIKSCDSDLQVDTQNCTVSNSQCIDNEQARCEGKEIPYPPRPPVQPTQPTPPPPDPNKTPENCRNQLQKCVDDQYACAASCKSSAEKTCAGSYYPGNGSWWGRPDPAYGQCVNNQTASCVATSQCNEKKAQCSQNAQNKYCS